MPELTGHRVGRHWLPLLTRVRHEFEGNRLLVHAEVPHTRLALDNTLELPDLGLPRAKAAVANEIPRTTSFRISPSSCPWHSEPAGSWTWRGAGHGACPAAPPGVQASRFHRGLRSRAHHPASVRPVMLNVWE